MPVFPKQGGSSGSWGTELVRFFETIFNLSTGEFKPPLDERTGLLIPLYVYPTAPVFTQAAWSLLVSLKKEYTNVPVTVIMNPASGPGTTVDANWTNAIDFCHGAGIKTVGYVATTFGAKAASVVNGEVDSWLSLYPAIDGIFWDEMSNGDTSALRSYYVTATAYAHTKSLFPVIGNQGTAAPSTYFSEKTADIIVISEGTTIPTESVLQGNAVGGHATVNKNRRAILLHGATGLDLNDFRLMRKYTGHLYITNDSSPNPWDVISTHLKGLFAMLSLPNEPSAATRMAIGTSLPSTGSILDIPSGGEALRIPQMTTAARDAIPSPGPGMIIFNLDTNVFNFYNGTVWGVV